MSQHMMFRRQPVPGQAALRSQSISMPAPTRGIIETENYGFMQPGGALVMDNWIPTMRGARLRGGCIRWSTLPETTPVISAFQYVTAAVQRIFAANATKLYDVSFGASPVLVKEGQTSGDYSAAQLANASDEWLVAVNTAGDYPLRFNGDVWETLDPAYTPPAGMPSKISVDPVKYPDAKVTDGRFLVHVCKYRNRLFFIELNSMNAWYLGINAVGGELNMIPLSGAATKGGKLLFCAVLSLDAGDGIDDKICFLTDLGELLIFTGSDPGNPTAWRQEGRFQIGPPMGHNAYLSVAGDLLIATLEGIVPVTAAISKAGADLYLAALTHPINRMWRAEAIDKREWSWTMHKWDEAAHLFVTWPGGKPGKRYCGVANAVTKAWCRFTGWDATCFMQLRSDMFFGTQDGTIMQADRSGKDDGAPYVATLVGGWGIFQQNTNTTVWLRARAAFEAGAGEPFEPQLSAATDYQISLPTPPAAGADRAGQDVWDQGLWDQAKWDQEANSSLSTRTTGWVSIGATGHTHAPIVQVTVAQQVRPKVELILIDAMIARGGSGVTV